jgi:hypothetical protein
MRLAITNQGSETGVTTLSNLSDSFRSLRCGVHHKCKGESARPHSTEHAAALRVVGGSCVPELDQRGGVREPAGQDGSDHPMRR